MDWFNMDQLMIRTLPPMLRDLSKNGHGYPANAIFDSREKWQSWLNEMASELEKCTEEYQDSQNEYWPEFSATLGTSEHYDPEISQKFAKRMVELQNESKERAKRVLSELGEHFFCLWD
jgi:L-rhamnose mutarotase